MQEFNFIDVAVGALIVLLGLKGLIRGVVKEVFGLISIVGGVYIASKYAFDFGEYINNNFAPIEKDGAKSLIGFLSLFISFWAIIQIAGTIFSKMLKVSGLGFVDKIGGMLVGSLKVFFIFSIIAYGFGSVKFIQEAFKQRLQNSYLYPILYKSGSYILNSDALPVDIKEKVDDIKKRSSKITDDIKEETTNNLKDEIKKQIEQKTQALTEQIKKEGN